MYLKVAYLCEREAIFVWVSRVIQVFVPLDVNLPLFIFTFWHVAKSFETKRSDVEQLDGFNW